MDKLKANGSRAIRQNGKSRIARLDLDFRSSLCDNSTSCFLEDPCTGMMKRSSGFVPVQKFTSLSILWRIDREGRLPDTPTQLRRKYLQRIPTEPLAGKIFYLAPRGLTKEQLPEIPRVCRPGQFPGGTSGWNGAGQSWNGRKWFSGFRSGYPAGTRWFYQPRWLRRHWP